MKAEQKTAEIKLRIAAGLVPPAKPLRIYGGPSLGGNCDACGMEIARRAIEYDVDLLDESGSVSRTLTMHAHCHEIWLELSRHRSTAAGETELDAHGEGPAEVGSRDRTP